MNSPLQSVSIPFPAFKGYQQTIEKKIQLHNYFMRYLQFIRVFWTRSIKQSVYWSPQLIKQSLVKGRNEVGKGEQCPVRRITGGGALKSPKNVASSFFDAVHLLPKHVRCEHGGAKLVSWPWRHLTSVRPCQDQKIIFDKERLQNLSAWS